MSFKLPNNPTEFVDFVNKNKQINIDKKILDELAKDRRVVEKALNSEEPVYGLNTGLGGNLTHRLDISEITDFQIKLIKGRAVATGKTFDENICRGLLLSRIVSASKGGSGISIGTFNYLVEFWNSGLSSSIPEIGSIGAGDLTQNAHLALGLIGMGELWLNGEIISLSKQRNKSLPKPLKLEPKDALVLINHKGVSLSLTAFALAEARRLYVSQEVVVAASLEGYQANTSIFSSDINKGREESGQSKVAADIRLRLKGAKIQRRKIQDALSFRTISPVLGALLKAIERADLLWKEDLNASEDNPAIINGELMSTPNFHSVALALQLEALCLAISAAASASNQRIQKMMNPVLSDLPKYLSPVGGSSAGMVPIQKTAGALLARIRHAAIPMAFDPPPVSDAVEDIAPLTSEVAKKLIGQLKDFRLILAIEGMVSCQAIDLRDNPIKSESTKIFMDKLRERIPKLLEDRPLGLEINEVALVLDQLSQS